uniref:hypothetical protein n=1 Tax=Ningiella ruwaisensis TaxID=2364274 RepID=UPI0010A011BA|nr:hypothetical protein [Ningiella ruwaisensis]
MTDNHHTDNVRQISSASKLENAKLESTHSQALLTLVIDEKTDIAMADKPIFGATVTIRDDINTLVGKILEKGCVLGWLNYVDVTKFACITHTRHYLEASHYFYAESNQLKLSQRLILHHVDTAMSKSKQLFTFSCADGKSHTFASA